MALQFLNAAWMLTSTVGTGVVTLGAAKTGYFTFGEAGLLDGNTARYKILNGNDFEIGIGTYTAAGTTFSRDTVLASKIGGTAGTSKINLNGAAEIFLTEAAEDQAFVALGNTFAAVQNVSSLITPNASGGDQGSDSINAKTYYKDGVALVSSAWTLIETLNPSGVATITNTVSLSGYNLIRISIYGLTPATNGVTANMQTSIDGSTFINWSSHFAHGSIGGAAWAVLSVVATSVLSAAQTISSTATNGGVNSIIDMFNYSQAENAYALISSGGFETGSSTLWHSTGMTRSSVNTARTHVRFSFSSGNISSGRIVIEGIA